MLTYNSFCMPYSIKCNGGKHQLDILFRVNSIERFISIFLVSMIVSFLLGFDFSPMQMLHTPWNIGSFILFGTGYKTEIVSTKSSVPNWTTNAQSHHRTWNFVANWKHTSLFGFYINDFVFFKQKRGFHEILNRKFIALCKTLFFFFGNLAQRPPFIWDSICNIF